MAGERRPTISWTFERLGQDRDDPKNKRFSTQAPDPPFTALPGCLTDCLEHSDNIFRWNIRQDIVHG
jgi:hypothetical protein